MMTREPDVEDRLEDYLTEAGAPAPAEAERPADTAAYHVDPADLVHCRLLTPIPTDAGMLDRLTLRPPTLGDLDDWSSGEISSSRALLARLAGVPEAWLKALVSPDEERVMARFAMLVPAYVVSGRDG
jgi:hypothetical protein